MRGRTFVYIALAAAAAAAGACRDATGSVARFRTATDTMVAFALTGSPPTAPAALTIAGFRTDSLGDFYADALVQRVDSIFDFDLAFDIDADGTPVLLTPRKVGTNGAIRFVRSGGSAVLVGPRRVGLYVPPAGTTFESLLEAPSGGFVFDSLVRVAPGQPIVLQTFSVSSVDPCSNALRQYLYARVVVDSAIAATRKVYFRVTYNRNCGFRSFQPGIPTD